jgi:hypothetical protein
MNFVKNPIVIGLIVALATYGVLVYTNKEDTEKKEKELMNKQYMLYAAVAGLASAGVMYYFNKSCTNVNTPVLVSEPAGNVNPENANVKKILGKRPPVVNEKPQVNSSSNTTSGVTDEIVSTKPFSEK